MPSNIFESVANLSVELFEESNHDHTLTAPVDECPACWTRRMAIDLMNYMWQSAGTVRIAA
ncbi:MAG TPA: hypothetical protein V6D17_07120 [Candidatus Obscuribacterales bacterium]